MEKIILVDGNNLLFRSYYATAYTGNLMRNKEGFPTNGLYGFVNMMNKIIAEENPKYIMVAFDIGKTFRHEQYDGYKALRSDTPDDLKKQFPVAKKILNAMGITYIEKEGYEADDIIGTFAKKVDEDNNYIATIVSSDKDLLQLISNDVTVKLLKTKDHIMMSPKVFKEIYGIDPVRMIDLKALMGDPSDNIPGVKGIGEKTALKLLTQYETLDDIYNNIENIKGSVQIKLKEGKEDAYFSYELATIYKDVPLDINFDDLVYKKENSDELINIYNDLGFYSFLKKIGNPAVIKEKELPLEVISDISKITLTKPTAIYVDLDNENYHRASINYIGLYNEDVNIVIKKENITSHLNKLSPYLNYTYDYKKVYVSLLKENIVMDNIIFDTMIAGYLLNYSVKDDICYMSHELDYGIPFNDKKETLEEEEKIKRVSLKAKFIYETQPILKEKLEKEQVAELFSEIEVPLSKVLAKMEIEGIKIDCQILEKMKEDINQRLEIITKDIYREAGCEFNISSPKQLGEVLFDKLKLPYAKKNKRGYVTDVNVLNKLKKYPIASLMLEHRFLSKLYSTYIEGLLNIVSADGKIHTIYTQTLTRTGRLSSVEPNLQNIPVRNEYGKLIRKAFIPLENSLIMSSDYSQIELRMFAHLSQIPELISAFNNKMDIHTKTAMDVFKVSEDMVTKDMRRQAKAVNFGIIYGISSFGLSEDLEIPVKEAKEFMNKYLDTYPGIKEYMEKEIKEAYNNGYVTTIMNRRRNIEELRSDNYNIRSMGERMALNTPVQGSSADILKKAMVEIDKEFTRQHIQSKMLLQVHDELIFNVKKEEKDKVEKIVKNIMENVYNLTVPLEVDISYGSNWYETK